MAIDRSLYAAPAGEEMVEDELLEFDLELEGEDDLTNVVEMPDGSIEVTFMDVIEAEEVPFDANLAEYLGEDDLLKLSGDLREDIDGDITARKEWVNTYVKGLKVLGLEYEERTSPWQNACGASSAILSEAVIAFQAETMGETFPAAGPVKTKIIGEEDREKLEAADRVQADMNYEITEVMTEYRPEHERMLYNLGLAGSAFKKVYYDPQLGRQTSVYVPAEEVIVPYGASTIEQAERVTHVMRKTPHEVESLQASGFYRDIDLGEPEPYHNEVEEAKAEEAGVELNNDNRHTLFEAHVMTTIPGIDPEGALAKPYIVTFERSSGEVLAIRRNWQPEDPTQRKRQHFVHYTYVPGLGFYGLGLIHIIGGYAKAGTSLLRQLVDAGSLANLPGGLKTRGLRIKGDDEPISPGEFKDVDVPAGTIKENIMTLPYKEPSQTLLALLDKITTEGRRLGATADINVSDMSANAPVGTTLAMLERTLKPMAAVQARVHYSMKQEFKLLKAIMAEHAPAQYGYTPGRGEVSAKADDYALVDVIPVSDPNNSTLAQRVVQMQTAMQMAEKAPHIYDQKMLHRQMLDILGVKNADKLVPMPEDMTPIDPVSENMNVLVGKPTKAFIYQDHTAHIAAHTAFMQDPMIAQTIGQNPQAQQIMAALHAHIAEHTAFQYRAKMEQKLGVPLTAPGAELPEEMEVSLSQLIAQAGIQLTQENQKAAAMQKAQQQAQDPMFQLEKQKVDNQTAEVRRKAQKDQMEAQVRVMEQAQKQRKDAADFMLDQLELQLDADKADQELEYKITKDRMDAVSDMLTRTTPPQRSE